MEKRWKQGFYKPINPDKYIGNLKEIIYRSSWEKGLCRWCDLNTGVEKWSSEPFGIPYRCVTDDRVHHYYIDFLIQFKNGKRLLVEVKPEAQTKVPTKGKRLTKKYLTEMMTYGKNLSKWHYAEQWAEAHGYTFKVFTENQLRKLGIKIIS